VRVDLVPLRERGPESIYRYLGQMLEAQGLPEPEEILDTAALQQITGWSWPGNLRELHHFATRAAQLFRARGRRLSATDLGRLMADDPPPARAPPSLPSGDAKTVAVMAALERCGWVQRRAAAELGISPSALNKFLSHRGLKAEVMARRRRCREASGDAPGTRPPPGTDGRGS